jgi:hypothetical protein
MRGHLRGGCKDVSDEVGTPGGGASDSNGAEVSIFALQPWPPPPPLPPLPPPAPRLDPPPPDPPTHGSVCRQGVDIWMLQGRPKHPRRRFSDKSDTLHRISRWGGRLDLAEGLTA